MYSPCLSAIVGVQPLSAPTRHCLGRPLPYQLADRTQAHPSARSYSLSSRELIKDYPRFRGAILNQRVDSYVLLTRPPLSALRAQDIEQSAKYIEKILPMRYAL